MFKLKAPFKPTGDQPQAIEKLVKNLKAGAKNQVLLGVTGSGKSVVGNTPIFIKERGQIICRPIGQFIDNLFQKYPNQVIYLNGSEILPMNQMESNLEAFSLNPITKQSEWKPILQLIRHSSLEALYQIKTTCGREITVTGDHNFWVLRDGKFVLLPTDQLKNTDYIPLPLEISGPEEDLSHINILPILKEEKLYINGRPFIIKALSEKRPKEIIIAMNKYYAFPSQRFYEIKNNVRPGMLFKTAYQLAQSLEIDFPFENITQLRVGPYFCKYNLPVKLPISNELLQLFGYYLAEGTSLLKSEYFQIANPNSFLQRKIKCILKKLKLHCSPSKNILYVGSKIHALLFYKLMGRNAPFKKLPEFWPNLSKKQLGLLLRAYFDGDGGAFPEEGRVAATTISKKLAFDLGYALFRFGIWARISKSEKNRKKDAWEVVISGNENLLKFKQCIGFNLPRQQKNLEELVRETKKSKMDIVPTFGKTIKNRRSDFEISQQFLANFSGVSRENLSAIETERSNPHRETFKKIIKAFIKFDKKNKKGVSLDKKLKTFLSCRWTKIKEIKQINSENDYVYDFSVKNNETFLAGFGGLFVHNTFTMAKVIENVQKPTLVVSPNKTLCAQLFQEFKDFFPDAGVHFFTSYYDYYQPEAYIPQTDTYIEKDAKINEEIDRLRHAAVQDLLTRDDVIIVASVSCIYNIGSPEDYQQVSLEIKSGQKIKRRDLLSRLTSLQYQRNDFDFRPGTFRVRGNIIDVYLVTGKEILRIEFFGDEIEKISISKDPLNPEFKVYSLKFKVFPAHFWVTPQEKIKIAMENIKLELQEQLKKLKKQKKLLEAQRLEQRTNYDLEMMKETGYCHGIENYSRHLEFRKPGEAPYTLLDYFGYSQPSDINSRHSDYIIFIDESHMTLPQLHAMANQDRARKETLIEYGFRLPSAIDNRPLTFKEFEEKVNQLIYVSATPADEERKKAGKKFIIEQLIRPTGLLEPSIEIRPIRNQVKDLVKEIKKRVEKKQRTLVLTLTKRLAEALSDYLADEGIKTQWLHSEVKTLERPQILKELREGKYDVLVGINLLREGLDLPEVALIAILDADKEGFLRSETTLIQTMGRAARHLEGHVILYADKITKSMAAAIKEVKRRRKIQLEYNKKHKITPQPIIKPIREWPFARREKEIVSEFWMIRDKELLEKEMKEAAKNLDFERAAEIRDLIKRIKNATKYERATNIRKRD
jgi:excinuclease ABC B subunit